ncbi:MAG: hypothetical protein JWO69_489 [Thermoleophilia bacterium]|nr:hypothetical protein [Thermoleophilia bacterium]
MRAIGHSFKFAIKQMVIAGNALGDAGGKPVSASVAKKIAYGAHTLQSHKSPVVQRQGTELLAAAQRMIEGKGYSPRLAGEVWDGAKQLSLSLRYRH